MSPLQTIPARRAKKEVRSLYLTAFPRSERLPFFVLRALTLRRGIAMTAYFESGTFLGFTHTTRVKKTLFVLFFAVQTEVRGKGYGSAILSCLKNTYPSCDILLNVEPPDPSAPNAPEREKRIAFYQKNGFADTGYDIDEVGGTFRVFSTSPDPDIAAYRRVFRHMSFGLWRPRIAKRQSPLKP